MKYLLPVLLLNICFITFSAGETFKDRKGTSPKKNSPSYTDSTFGLQKKINAFWEKTRADLSLIQIDAKVEPLKDMLPYRAYSVTVCSLDSVMVTGFLAIPVQGEAPAKPWPVIINTVGYSGRGDKAALNECMRGYAILQVYPRGQGESEKYFKLKGDKVSTNLNRPEDAYYRGGYADIIRMIDYVTTRSDIDSSRIAMVSASQGGGIALAVAALDTRIKAVVAHVPFLCNFRLAATIPKSLVKVLLDREKANNEAALQTLDYFDPLHLAPMIRVPVLMSAGGKDELCPMKTIRSVYKRIHSRKKKLKIYPDLPHTTCMDFYNITWPWLGKHFRK